VADFLVSGCGGVQRGGRGMKGGRKWRRGGGRAG